MRRTIQLHEQHDNPCRSPDWQDVYHAKTVNRAEVELKLTVIDDVLIVSFKEL